MAEETEGEEIDVEGLEHEIIQILKQNRGGKDRVKNRIREEVETNE